MLCVLRMSWPWCSSVSCALGALFVPLKYFVFGTVVLAARLLFVPPLSFVHGPGDLSVFYTCFLCCRSVVWAPAFYLLLLFDFCVTGGSVAPTSAYCLRFSCHARGHGVFVVCDLIVGLLFLSWSVVLFLPQEYCLIPVSVVYAFQVVLFSSFLKLFLWHQGSVFHADRVLPVFYRLVFFLCANPIAPTDSWALVGPQSAGGAE